MRVVRPLKIPSKEDVVKYWEPRQELLRDVMDLADRQVRVKIPDAKPIPGVTTDAP
jgi:hypothetical protein